MPGNFTAAQRRRLHSCLGIAPGTGKADAMLAEANRVAGQGIDMVGLERIPPRRIRHRGGTFDELDVDAVSRCHPWDVLVDKPAPHLCSSSRHERRWEDAEELLGADIDVITSLNVQPTDRLGEATN